MKKLSSKTIFYFTQTMTELLKSGVPLQHGLEICGKTKKTSGFRFFSESLLKDIRNGKKFSLALSKYKNDLGAFYLEVVRLGEETNCLPQMMENLTLYLKTFNDVKGKLRQALIYPAFVCLTTVVVALTILFFVFPKISAIFEAFSESSIYIEETIVQIKYSVLFFSGFLIFVLVSTAVLFFLYKTSECFRKKADRVFINLPLAGSFLKSLYTRDFIFVMQLMCPSPLSFTEALKRSTSVIRNREYSKQINFIYEKICRGESIGDSFSHSGVFSDYLVTWISIASATGNLKCVFKQINEYYSKEINESLETFMTLVEPVLILITGVFMFFMIAQFVLPVFSLLGRL